MVGASAETAACPHPGCPLRGPTTPGLRCQTHGRPLVRESVLAAHADDPLIGRTIKDDYDLIDIIGRGAMGAVYRGWQQSQQRSVAIKVISGKAVQALDEPVKRFIMEARALAAMPPHPAIVGIYDYGEDDGLLYMVLELVEGPSLKAFSRNRRLPAWQVADIAHAVLGALGKAHEAGVVHRDLKPSNVVMCSDDPDETGAKVLDFGVAKVFWPDDQLVQEVVTRAGMALGTPKYMSPEQARGQTVGPGSDLYALGVMLYRLLAGKLPFTGDNDLQVLKAHILKPPPPWPEGVEVPAELDAFVRRLLNKRPIDRFTDADAAGAVLAGIRPSLGGPDPAAIGLPGGPMDDDPTDMEVRTHSAGSQAIAAEMGPTPPATGRGATMRTVAFVAAAVALGAGVGLLGLGLAGDDQPPAVEQTADGPAERVAVGAAPSADTLFSQARQAAVDGDVKRARTLLTEALAAADDPAAMRQKVIDDIGFEDARNDPAFAALLEDDSTKP